jgi:hypothetical protein
VNKLTKIEDLEKMENEVKELYKAEGNLDREKGEAVIPLLK